MRVRTCRRRKVRSKASRTVSRARGKGSDFALLSGENANGGEVCGGTDGKVSFEKLQRNIAITPAFEIHWRTATEPPGRCLWRTRSRTLREYRKGCSTPSRIHANDAFPFAFFFFMITPYRTTVVFMYSFIYLFFFTRFFLT